MKTFSFEIEGITPLMHHKFSEKEFLKITHGTKEAKTKVKSSENSPRELAREHLYADEKGCFIPTKYLTGAVKHVAVDYKQTKGKRTFKAILGGVFVPTTDKIYLTKNKNVIKEDEFEVDIQIGNNRNAGKSCAVAIIRPRFDNWRASGTIKIDTDMLSQEKALEMMQDAGRRSGIGSYRVANGGHYGQFQVIDWRELKEK